MIQTYTIRQKIQQLLIILLPILVTQLTLFAMIFFDTVMTGNVSSSDMAGVAIGSSIWVPVSTGLNGILLAVTPIVAQLVGAEKKDQVSSKVIQGIYLAFIISVIVILLGFFLINPILHSMKLDSTVREVAKGYLIALAFGIIPSFIYTVFRCFMDALGQTRVTMIISLLSLPINVVLNYLFIYGNFGFPRLGGIGAGVATAITYWCIALIAFYFIRHKEPFSSFDVFGVFHGIRLSIWREIVKIGVPIGFAIFFETAVFSGVTILMSQFDTVTIAAHTAALNFASFLYMVPLSISMALTILVGFEAGGKRFRDARQYGYLGLGLSVTMAVFTAIFLYLLKDKVAMLYSNEAPVILLAQKFLLYALFFQLSDAIATPVQGVLRGYKDVNLSFILTFLSFWVVGLPVGYLLANYTSLEAFGYWMGLISGLAVGAIGLLMRLVVLQRKYR